MKSAESPETDHADLYRFERSLVLWHVNVPTLFGELAPIKNISRMLCGLQQMMTAVSGLIRYRD